MLIHKPASQHGGQRHGNKHQSFMCILLTQQIVLCVLSKRLSVRPSKPRMQNFGFEETHLFLPLLNLCFQSAQTSLFLLFSSPPTNCARKNNTPTEKQGGQEVQFHLSHSSQKWSSLGKAPREVTTCCHHHQQQSSPSLSPIPSPSP